MAPIEGPFLRSTSASSCDDDDSDDARAYDGAYRDAFLRAFPRASSACLQPLLARRLRSWPTPPRRKKSSS